jgi:hypothetical protein
MNDRILKILLEMSDYELYSMFDMAIAEYNHLIVKDETEKATFKKLMKLRTLL